MDLNKMNHNLTHSFLTLSIANLLLACGGCGDDSAAPPVTPNLGQLSALNGLKAQVG